MITIDEAIKYMESQSACALNRETSNDWLQIASMLEELKDLRKCVRSSAFRDGYATAVYRIKNLEVTGIEYDGRKYLDQLDLLDKLDRIHEDN